MMTIRRAPLLLAATLVLAACGREETPAGVIPREKFIAANVEVRSLPDGATPEQRAAVLRKHGVTEKQMKAWVTGHSRDPEVLAKAWEEIAFKLDSAGNPPVGGPPAPSSRPPSGRVPPPRPVGMQGPPGIVPPPPPAAVGEPPARAPRRKRIQQVQ